MTSAPPEIGQSEKLLSSTESEIVLSTETTDGVKGSALFLSRNETAESGGATRRRSFRKSLTGGELDLSSLDDQQGLLKAQVNQINSPIKEMRREMNNMKDEFVTKEMEQVIENMMGEHEDHRDHFTELHEEIRQLKDSFEAYKITTSDKLSLFETRFEGIESKVTKHYKDFASLENKLNDHSKSHSDKLGIANQKLLEVDAALSLTQSHLMLPSVSPNQATLEQRVDYLEKVLLEEVQKLWMSLDRHTHDMLPDIRSQSPVHRQRVPTRISRSPPPQATIVQSPTPGMRQSLSPAPRMRALSPGGFAQSYVAAPALALPASSRPLEPIPPLFPSLSLSASSQTLVPHMPVVSSKVVLVPPKQATSNGAM
jgi:hypothetical protein